MALRRKPGIAGIKREAAAKTNFKATGEQLAASQAEHMTQQLQLFKANLESFAAKHKHEINANPVFRAQFTRLCTQVGVDPLASHKGFWSELLGVGDFYYELAVQLIDICLSTRSANGGLIGVDELLRRLKLRRGKQSQEISADDVTYSLKAVKALGNGYQLLQVGGTAMVVSVPLELNTDHVAIMELAKAGTAAAATAATGPPAAADAAAAGAVVGAVSVNGITRALGWPRHRIDAVLNLLLREGMAWLDSPPSTPPEAALYFFPSLFQGLALGAGASSAVAGSAGAAAAAASATAYN